MIVDDVEGFLKFLDNVSYQLACLLDIDGERSCTRKSFASQQKISLPSRTRLTKSRTKTSKRQKIKLQQPTRLRGRRKVDKLEEFNENTISDQRIQEDLININNNDQHQSQHLQHQITEHHLSQQQQLQHRHHQHDQDIAHSNKLQHTNSSEAHGLEGQLTLSIVDDLPPLDHGSSISPATHLSPLDSSIQFNPIHHQHYYPQQRGHLDSYQLHDEFTSHEPIPITNSTPHINQEQQRVSQLMGHQQSSMRPETLDTSALHTPTDCYPHQPIHHHHQHSTPYHQLDQQWLGATNHTNDSTLQLGPTDQGALIENVVSLSPATHQSLDHVQFDTPLYHHSYYNHQSEQLDSFQHLTEEYTTNSGSLTVNSSSPINHLNRVQRDQQQQQQQQQQAHTQYHQQHQLRMTSLNNGNQNNLNYEQQHHHNQTTQADHNHLHTYPNNIQNHNLHHHHHHHQHDHHQQQQQQHQMLPLLNGLEPSGVIIQDINLASASWSSPEDLYSI